MNSYKSIFILPTVSKLLESAVHVITYESRLTFWAHISVASGQSISPHVREFKTVLNSGFYAVDSWFFVSGTWIPDSNNKWDSGFLELYSAFQRSGFLILLISEILIPCALFRIPKIRISDSKFLYMRRGVHSTEFAALSFSDTIRRNIDQDQVTAAVSIDLREALDIVDHSLL